MSTATDDLQAALASFRTRSSELWNWRAVYRYTDEAEQGVGELTGLARLHGAAITIPYVEKAIASAFRVLMRADDSNGGIQIVIQELLELHQQLCLVEAPDVDRLVAWLQKFEFGETGEYSRSTSSGTPCRSASAAWTATVARCSGGRRR